MTEVAAFGGRWWRICPSHKTVIRQPCARKLLSCLQNALSISNLFVILSHAPNRLLSKYRASRSPLRSSRVQHNEHGARLPVFVPYDSPVRLQAPNQTPIKRASRPLSLRPLQKVLSLTLRLCKRP
ncbi:hypothetical protein BU16DRAFT_173 [Lophium mytilinum]|uniref:Uncharacterized protein n=1 Tax=Lophium mytilinum TaxID=390894 RepID=A0A6A6RAY6_9PEZI|nr:hypothetical protein BU16DRAFT_173 [Lophium mytilinum]